VDNSKDEFDFCPKVCASVFILEVLRPAGETRVGRNAFGAGLLAVLSGDETKRSRWLVRRSRPDPLPL
jgi:hypothetical protein